MLGLSEEFSAKLPTIVPLLTPPATLNLYPISRFAGLAIVPTVSPRPGGKIQRTGCHRLLSVSDGQLAGDVERCTAVYVLRRRYRSRYGWDDQLIQRGIAEGEVADGLLSQADVQFLADGDRPGSEFAQVHRSLADLDAADILADDQAGKGSI